MGGHHHHGGGGRGRGWGGGYYPYPVIVEDYWDDPTLFVGAEKKMIALHVGPAASPPPMPAVPTPLSSTPDAGLTDAATAPVAVPIPAAIAIPAAPVRKSLIPAGGALAGGVAGFAVGGPVGAAIGAAVGYFGGKAVDNKTTSVTQSVVAPPAPTTPTVNGDCCWNGAAGWSPHGDERMR